MPGESGSLLITRRTILSLSALGFVGLRPLMVQGNPLVGEASRSPAEDSVQEKERTKEDWFNEYFTSKPSVGALHVFRFADEMYAITKPIAWTPGKGEEEASFKPVNVPKGFVTDFASVPRIFWQFLPRDGKYTYPAIIHDYLYWVQDRPRESADEIFRISMKEFSLDPIVINAVYWGVRAGGGIAWKNNAAAKVRGERRILKLYPDDPLVRWSSWKTKSDVFLPQ